MHLLPYEVDEDTSKHSSLQSSTYGRDHIQEIGQNNFRLFLNVLYMAS
jgi:hypothetical protein